MTSASSARAFDVRHLQLARALFAAIAAIMVTFSSDHSAVVGLSVFSGFAVATGLVFALAAWLVFPAGRRGSSVLLAVVTLAAGMIASIAPWRSTEMFFALVISWAVVAGLIEALAGWRTRRDAAERAAARDGITVGIITVVLGLALLFFVRADYSLDYFVERSFTLTGITIAVGVFGGYAAIVAVYLGIAGLSPRREPAVLTPSAEKPEEADA